MKFSIPFFFAFIKVKYWPDANLVTWLLIAIALDFVTGFSKAAILKQNRTSTGLRKTVIKILQYVGALAAVLIISNTAKENENGELLQVLKWANNGLLIFIIYIEVVSIFENLLAIDNTSMVAKYVFTPIHRLLTLAIKNNPLNQNNEK
jgi:phage-related holin